MKLARICPDAIFGPLLTPHLNLSHALVLAYMDGSIDKIPNDSIGGVDVRDVASAHLAAFVKLEAGEELSGRYLMSWDFMRYLDLVTLLKDSFPGATFPEKEEDIRELGFRAIPATVDCSPVATELGIHMRPPGEVIMATVKALIDKGHLILQAPSGELPCM